MAEKQHLEKALTPDELTQLGAYDWRLNGGSTVTMTHVASGRTASAPTLKLAFDKLQQRGR